MIRLGTQRKELIIQTQDDELPKDTYRRAKMKVDEVINKTHGKAIVSLISLSVAFKPKGNKPHKGWLWCPCCNSWRVFRYNDELGVNKCVVCGISDQDYYVKRYNGIFRKENIERKKRGRL